MLYVSGKSFGGMYLLADSETGEEWETTEEAILNKAKSGVPIYRVYKEDNNYIIRLPGIGENASLEYYAVTNNKQYLLDEYDSEKNDLSVTSIKYNANMKVHWICPKGHKYTSVMRNRTVLGRNCPYCAGKRVSYGDNDLETWCKSNDKQYIFDEWDSERNNIKPSEVAPFSNKKFWWLCPKGHSYEMALCSRTNLNCNCPICSGRTVQSGSNDLETWCRGTDDRQYLLDEWNYEKNDKLPSEYTVYSNQKVYWRCHKGHEYDASINSRTNLNSNCPYCAHQKVLVGETDFETYCRANNHRELLEEWDYEKNNVKPSEIFPFSHAKRYWVCKARYHSYTTSTANRLTEDSGCPYCSPSTSFQEQAILYYINKSGIKAVNRYKHDNKYEIDVYLPDYNIGIEYDGVAWHSSDDKVRRDEEKNRVLSNAGIRLIRLRESGCPEIEKFGAFIIEVVDLDSALISLKSVLNTFGVATDIEVDTRRDRQAIQESYRTDLKERSIKVTHPQIAYEWCREKNGDLKPEMFSAGNTEKVWWRCSKCNGEYKSSVAGRCKNKNGCPFCARVNSKIIGTQTFCEYPEIKPFWSDKNPPMEETLFYTAQHLTICCPECGFEETLKYKLSSRVNRQEGLTCKKCGYHVKVDKWEKERRDFLEKQKRDEDMMASFNEFLKKQGLSGIGE